MRANAVMSVIVAVLLIGVGFYAGAQVAGVDATRQLTSDERIDGLEVRVTLLEATVEAISGNDGEASQSANGTRTITGEYVERPEVVSGQKCTNFYAAGTTVFLSDWDGEVLGTGKLDEGKTITDGLCSQSFAIQDVPERPGYIVNFERRAIGSSYEFTLEEIQENDWHIVVVSRYRN